MLPLLELSADGQEHKVSDATQALSDAMNLTAEERQLTLPSGRQAAMANRVGWARTYLTKAGLLDSPRRGSFVITGRGRKVLADKPGQINVRFLRQFPEFLEFIGKSPTDSTPVVAEDSAETAEELLERSIKQLERQTAAELLDTVRNLTPLAFEKLVLNVLLAMGYGEFREDAGHHLGMPGDEGIDGLINEDELGLDAVYIQAKKWKNPVGGPDVRTFAGSLAGKKATKGVLITSSTFTSDAYDFVRVVGQRIVLIDGQRLAELMIKHNVGVTSTATYAVKRLDSDYFEEL
jgi:restriction system protein